MIDANRCIEQTEGMKSLHDIKQELETAVHSIIEDKTDFEYHVKIIKNDIKIAKEDIISIEDEDKQLELQKNKMQTVIFEALRHLMKKLYEQFNNIQLMQYFYIHATTWAVEYIKLEGSRRLMGTQEPTERFAKLDELSKYLYIGYYSGSNEQEGSMAFTHRSVFTIGELYVVSGDVEWEKQVKRELRRKNTVNHTISKRWEIRAVFTVGTSSTCIVLKERVQTKKPEILYNLWSMGFIDLASIFDDNVIRRAMKNDAGYQRATVITITMSWPNAALLLKHMIIPAERKKELSTKRTAVKYKKASNTAFEKAGFLKQQIDDGINYVKRGKQTFREDVRRWRTEINEHKKSKIDNINETCTADMHVLDQLCEEKNKIFEKQERNLEKNKTDLNDAIRKIRNNPETGNLELQTIEEEIKRSEESFLYVEHLKPTITGDGLKIVNCKLIIYDKDRSFSVTKGQPFSVNVQRKYKSDHDTCLLATLICPSGNGQSLAVVEDKKHGEFTIRAMCDKEGDWMMEVMATNKHYIKGSPVNIKVAPMGIVNDTTTTVFNKLPSSQYFTDVLLLDTEGSMLVSTNCEFFKFDNSGECVINTKCKKKIKRLHQMSNGYIVYTDKESIVKCDDKLKPITTFDDEKLLSPVGLTISNETRVMYVADSSAHCVFKFNIDDGSLIGTIGEHGSKEGQMYNPMDVALLGRDRIVVTDFGNHRVQMFDVVGLHGKYVKTIADKGEGDGQVEDPCGIVIDDDDNIIVSSRNKLQLFDKDGGFLRRIDETKDAIDLPSSITVISKRPRRLAVVNSGGKNVKVYNY
ncbi:uncharacterized protein [Antedon mediterranea]|uniref:uncharacterized protein n=1 Tax=Antedon mediterranea TaxID=105859 RepID=UPI003AF67C07